MLRPWARLRLGFEISRLQWRRPAGRGLFRLFTSFQLVLHPFTHVWPCNILDRGEQSLDASSDLRFVLCFDSKS